MFSASAIEAGGTKETRYHSVFFFFTTDSYSSHFLLSVKCGRVRETIVSAHTVSDKHFFYLIIFSQSHSVVIQHP